jgi:hypothetical protein
VDYALEVPGGYIYAVLGSTADETHFDESTFEKLFPTLRVINNPTKKALFPEPETNSPTDK